MKIKTAESLVVVHTHTHTSLLGNKRENKLEIEETHRLSI